MYAADSPRRRGGWVVAVQDAIGADFTALKQRLVAIYRTCPSPLKLGHYF